MLSEIEVVDGVKNLNPNSKLNTQNSKLSLSLIPCALMPYALPSGHGSRATSYEFTWQLVTGDWQLNTIRN
jgi:hypothetical protein